MPVSPKVHIDFKPSTSSRSVKIRVLTEKLVQVSYPKRVRKTDVNQFVHKHRSYINRRLQEIAEEKVAFFNQDTRIISTGQVSFVRKTTQMAYAIKISPGKILVELPEYINIERINTLLSQLAQVLKRQAKRELPDRLLQLAQIHHKSVNDVRTKLIRTRWGSCSSKSNINLSAYLLLLPDSLIDYVMLHELAHLKEMNHSIAFWQHLETICPNARILDTQLNHFKLPIKQYMEAVLL